MEYLCYRYDSSGDCIRVKHGKIKKIKECRKSQKWLKYGILFLYNISVNVYNSFIKYFIKETDEEIWNEFWKRKILPGIKY